MNIFSVLSQGKSRLHEPSISAMLGYLLSPQADHGLSDTFLRAFIDLINSTSEKEIINGISEGHLQSANVELEVQYTNKNKRNDIDVQISILDKRDSKELHRIIIENKIKIGAANPKQLEDYYNAVINDKDFQLESPRLTLVFLTPDSDASSLNLEYNNLERTLNAKHNSAWIRWSVENSSESVLGIIKSILTKELNAEINPINEYMRHTLKAFVRHVESVTSVKRGIRKMRIGQDIGDIIDEVIISTKDGTEYRIIRRDSTQIQVYNVETGEKETARYIMAQYIDENNLEIEHDKYNTRTIGKKLLDIINDNQ